jgi:hypothetical protein
MKLAITKNYRCVENEEICILSPIRLHGVVIKYLSKGKLSPTVKQPKPEADLTPTNTVV